LKCFLNAQKYERGRIEMNEAFCELCTAPLLKEAEELCEVYQVRINYLIKRHKEAVREIPWGKIQ
jgi:hypothetical protein